MKSITTNFLRNHWDAILASVTGCLFIYFYTRHSGIGISPDSVNYLSAANNIRSHFSFTDFNGMPLVDFPLGYPCLLALLSFISGFTVIQLVPVLNCILLSGIIISTSIIINGYTKSSAIYKIIFLSILACSPFILEVYSMLWSETFFLFLILLFVIAIKKYFTTHRTLHLVLVSLIVALAFVTRYAGISLMVTAGFLLLFNGELNTRKKLKHILVLGIMGSSLVAANLIRNHYAAGHIAGVREKALRSLGDNIQQMGETFSEWLPFLRGHITATSILLLIILLSAIFILIKRTLQQQYFQSYETIITCFFVMYVLFMLTIATISRFENLSSRLLSPIYIPLLLVGSSWIVNFLTTSIRIKRIVVLFVCLILFAGFHYNHYRLNAEAWEGIKDAGIPGYTEDSWTQSPAVAYIKKNKDKYVSPVFANANDAVYFLTGIHATALPHKEIKQEIDAFLQHPSFYLIWFNEADNTDLISLDFIKQHKTLVSVEELEGGAVYYFSADR